MAMNNPQFFNPLRFVERRMTTKSRKVLAAEIAYFRAQSRGFEPGHELEDWIAAEAEVERLKTDHDPR
jgi:hypothetical protein